MGKLSPFQIIYRHFKSLCKIKDGKDKVSISDILIQMAFPIALGGFSYAYGFTMSDKSGLLSGMSILATLLGAVAVFVFQIRVQQRQNRDTLLKESDIDLIDELFFNILWIILVGLVQSSLLIVSEAIGIIGETSAWQIVSAVSVVLSTNVVVTLLMVLKRLARIYMRIGMHLDE